MPPELAEVYRPNRWHPTTLQLGILHEQRQLDDRPDLCTRQDLARRLAVSEKQVGVWFQNARAKWRRTKAQDSSTIGGSEGCIENSSVSALGE